MGGEGGVVSAAVLRVEHQGEVQDLSLQLGILAVRPQAVKDIFRGGKVRLRHMDKQALAVVVMAVGLVAVNRNQREQGDKLQALAQHVGNADVVGVFIIGIQGQHAAGQGVHHIRAGAFMMMSRTNAVGRVR